MKTRSPLLIAVLLLAGCQMFGKPLRTGQNARKDEAWDAQRASLKYELANTELKGGSLDKALGLAREAVALEPNRADHIALLARVYISKGDFSTARSLLENALEKHPDFAGCAYVLGTIYERDRRWDRAVETYGRAVESEPSSLEYRIALAQCVAQISDTPTAMRVLLDCEDRFDAEPLFHVAAAEIARGGGDLSTACHYYDRALQLGCEDESTRISLALCNYWQGHAEDALEQLEPLMRGSLGAGSQASTFGSQTSTFVSRSPGYTSSEPQMSSSESRSSAHPADEVTLQTAYAGALIETGRIDQACDWLARFTVQHPNVANLWVLFAQARCRKGDTAGAVLSASRAVRLLPDSPETHLMLATTLLADNQLARAADSAAAALRIKPDDATALLLAGRIAEKRGRTAEATAAFTRAAQLDPHNDLAKSFSKRTD